MTPEISVIFSTHDRPASLQRSIDSVLTQTRLPLELIVVHDSAGALAADIADILAVAGERFLYLRHRPASLTQSRNHGIAMARGDVLLLLDDDVILPSDYLARLARLYQIDERRQIAGIGGVLVDPASRRLGRRIWDFLAEATGLCRWTPRRVAARHLALPRALRNRLVPARRLYGGAVSLRRDVAKANPFDESFTGYCFGEDLEYSFRVGRDWPLFLAPQLKVRHEVAPTGRPAMRARGRMYVANFLYIFRKTTDPLAGTRLLLGLDLAATVLRYLLWSAVRLRRDNLDFALGMLQGLAEHAGRAGRRILCGC